MVCDWFAYDLTTLRLKFCHVPMAFTIVQKKTESHVDAFTTKEKKIQSSASCKIREYRSIRSIVSDFILSRSKENSGFSKAHRESYQKTINVNHQNKLLSFAYNISGFGRIIVQAGTT